MSSRKEILAEGIEVWLGDCREVLPQLGRVDAVVTDPPYGVNLGNHLAHKDGRKDHVLRKGSYASYDDTLENFVSIVVPALRQAISMADRSLIFCAGSNVWHLPPADVIGGVYIPAAQGRNKWGFTSLSHVLLYGSAPALHLGARHTALRSTEVVSSVIDHPCPKPLGWMNWAVDLASLAGDMILDPFMGSGTTGVAAVKLGRCFIGIEIEERYFAIACQRIDEALKQPDMFMERPASVRQEVLDL